MSRRILWTVSLLALLTAWLLPRPAGAWCWWSCDYTKTKNPIVLSHGFMGFDTALGIMDYWYGIVEELEDDGATVYVTEVAVANSSINRGEQLIAQLDDIRAIRGQPNLKFNLIGHSQGGLDIRYVAGVRPDLVASLTTVASPHVGVDFIEALGGMDNLPDAMVDIMGPIFDLYGTLMGNQNPNDAAAAMAMFDPAGLAVFNADFPLGMPGSYCGEGAAVVQTPAGTIRNYSWTGSQPMTNVFDILDPVFGILSLLYDEPNDGLVERCGSHFGDVIRDNYKMNHLDEINQLFGIVSWFDTNPKSTFRTHANRLKKAGL